MGFTENAKNQMEEIKNDFPNLWKYYDEFVGNFGFTENELFENMSDILLWMEKHNNYKLLYQDGYDMGYCWWLTDFE